MIRCSNCGNTKNLEYVPSSWAIDHNPITDKVDLYCDECLEEMLPAKESEVANG